MASDPEHSEPTRRNGYRYLFSVKHHGGGSRDDSQWMQNLSREQEFTVFDVADCFEVKDEDGWLFGVWSEDGKLQDLGTWGQQIAAFPSARKGVPWHGYPIWAVSQDAPENRSTQKLRPSKQIFLKLEEVSLITKRQRKRLWKGDHT